MISESVARPRLAPPHSGSRTLLPSLRGRMGSEQIERASEQIRKFELSPWTLVPVPVSVAPTPSAFGKTGQGNSIQGSTYCSASLRAADYNDRECQALKGLPIDYSQNSTGMMDLDAPCNATELEVLARRLDKDQNGSIDYREFSKGLNFTAGYECDMILAV